MKRLSPPPLVILSDATVVFVPLTPWMRCDEIERIRCEAAPEALEEADPPALPTNTNNN